MLCIQFLNALLPVLKSAPAFCVFCSKPLPHLGQSVSFDFDLWLQKPLFLKKFESQNVYTICLFIQQGYGWCYEVYLVVCWCNFSKR